jgi:putative MATE family efflux protein
MNESKRIEDKFFYRTMISLALPIIIQNLISSCLNMVDTLMIGKLGETEIAAVGLANQYYFFYALVIFGIASSSGIFIAQFYGKGDLKSIHRVLGIGLIIGCSIAVIFTVLTLLNPDGIMRIFTGEPDVIAVGKEYLAIVAFTFLLFCINAIHASALRSTRQPRLPMLTSIAALAANTMLNYILIFGHLGFKPMGVRGAAIATLISRIIELTLTLTIVYYRKNMLAAQLRDLTDIPMELIKRFIKSAVHIVLNDGLWGLAVMVCTIAYARMGKQAMAAIQISNTVQNVFFVIIGGLASACAIMIGNKIGEGNEEKAFNYAVRSLKLALILGFIHGTVLFLIAPLVPKWFNITPDTYSITVNVIRVLGIVIFVKFFNFVMSIGVLRSGGDTKFIMLLELATIWLIAVPTAFVGALILRLPVHCVVLLVTLEEFIKIFIEVPRILSKKWLNNLVEMSSEAAIEGESTQTV